MRVGGGNWPRRPRVSPASGGHAAPSESPGSSCDLQTPQPLLFMVHQWCFPDSRATGRAWVPLEGELQSIPSVNSHSGVDTVHVS